MVVVVLLHLSFCRFFRLFCYFGTYCIRIHICWWISYFLTIAKRTENAEFKKNEKWSKRAFQPLCYGWFLHNFEKDFIPTFLHMSVAMMYKSKCNWSESWATITHFCTENSATVYTLKSPDLGLLHELTPLATAIQTFCLVFSKILSQFKPTTFRYKKYCFLYKKHQISFIFDQDRIMKNFIWIAIFFTVGYATPIPQVGGKLRIF